MTNTHNSPRSFSIYYAIFLTLTKNFSLHFIRKQTAKPRGKIIWWKPICMFFLIGRRTIRQGSCPYQNPRTTMLNMQVPVIRRLSSTAAIMLVNLLRIKSTITRDPTLLTNWQKSWERWCQSANNIYSTPQNYKNNHTIRG